MPLLLLTCFSAHTRRPETDTLQIPWNEISTEPLQFYDDTLFSLPVQLQAPNLMSLPNLYTLINYLSTSQTPFAFHTKDKNLHSTSSKPMGDTDGALAASPDPGSCSLSSRGEQDGRTSHMEPPAVALDLEVPPAVALDLEVRDHATTQSQVTSFVTRSVSGDKDRNDLQLEHTDSNLSRSDNTHGEKLHLHREKEDTHPRLSSTPPSTIKVASHEVQSAVAHNSITPAPAEVMPTVTNPTVPPSKLAKKSKTVVLPATPPATRPRRNPRPTTKRKATSETTTADVGQAKKKKK
jgi:hypothetical protein